MHKMFIWENRIEAKTSSDAFGIEEVFNWRFLRRHSSEVNFCEASPSPGLRVRLFRCAHSCACAASIENVFECFKFPLHWSGAPVRGQSCTHVREDVPALHLLNMCLCSKVCTWLVQNSSKPVGSLSECFVWACTTWLNHRRSTKVLFSDMYVMVYLIWVRKFTTNTV